MQISEGTSDNGFPQQLNITQMAWNELGWIESTNMVSPRRLSSRSSVNDAGTKLLTGQCLPRSEWEAKNAQLRRRVSSVEEEKACLQTENRQLISELESLQLELANYKTKVRVLGSSVESKSSSASLMKEQIDAMEHELETQRFALRDSEKKQDEVLEILEIRCRQVMELTEDVRVLRTKLEDQITRGQRVEHQRNEALTSAEKQTQALLSYKTDMTQKLKKLSENENLLKHSLIQCDREKAEVEEKCSKLEQERGEMTKLISQLKKDSGRTEVLRSESESLRSQLEEAAKRSADREQCLKRKEAEMQEATEALRRENGELRLLTTSLEQQLEQRLRQVQHGRAQLASLEAILSLLHLQESEGASLCVNPCLLPPVPADDVPKLQPGERYEKLLPVLRVLEQERVRQAKQAQGLQEQLGKAQEEAGALQASMARREQLLQQLQSQLQQRLSQVAQLEEEIKKKTARLAAADKQLDEKTKAISLATEKTSELEQSLAEKTKDVQLLRKVVDTGKREYHTALEDAHKQHTEQCRALEDRVRTLQDACSSAQEEKEKAQYQLTCLQQTLSLEAEANNQREQEALRSLGDQAAQYSSRVKGLETALSACQEELSRCLLQMETAQSHFQQQLDAKNREVESLRGKLVHHSKALKSSSQESLQLQHTNQQMEARLKDLLLVEGDHVSLLHQVEELKDQLQRERASAELTRTEEAQEAARQADTYQRETVQLTDTIRQLSVDVDKCRGELSERDKELLLMRRASGAQATQLEKMEKMLSETRGMLDKKTETVQDLEEKVQRSKRDRRNSLHRTQLLESQMKTVRGELVDTLDHLQELRNVLRRSQQQAEERKAAMEKLATGLRETQEELEERNGQIKEKDETLAEKELELQQKAQELSQLESTVEEHRAELQRTLETLQEEAQRAERELSERNKQVAFLSERLELVRSQLQGKETLEEEAACQAHQLRECREQLQRMAQRQQELRSHCDDLDMQLKDSTSLARDKESQVRVLEEELSISSEQAAQVERRLKEAVSRLALELEVLKTQHQTELAALQESQAEMMRASECVTSTVRSSQEHLSVELQQTRTLLDEAQRNATALLAELHAREHVLHNTSEALLLKESEVTRLKTRLSSLERGIDMRNLSQSVGIPLPPLTTHGIGSPSPPPHHLHHLTGENTTLSLASEDWAADGSTGSPERVGQYTALHQSAPHSPRGAVHWTEPL
ncbi:coiled-coil domain-containing protein 18-like isoform X2 [Engraulis encrasicolus]|uniref:coiled-coil domain-containing protein 18-like isoform X2 n=1 Tax=Engraulis encrasicolus TaxID=184585 RepID=UPI002FD3FF2F